MTDQAEALLSSISDALGAGWVAIIGALAIAGATFLFPGVRWQRQLRHDMEVLNGMSIRDNTRRDWERRTRRKARQLAEYRLHVPWWRKLVGWMLTAIYLFTVGTILWELLVSRSFDWSVLGIGEWAILVAMSPLVVLLGIGLVRGRTIEGWTVRQWMANQKMVDPDSKAAMRVIGERAERVAKLKTAEERASRRRVTRFREKGRSD